ncbi:MAG: hypothetical protein AABZ10_09635 [Nitrospirota bacterium]
MKMTGQYLRGTLSRLRDRIGSFAILKNKKEGEKELIIRTAIVAVLVPLVLFITAGVLLYSKGGILYFSGVLLISCALVAVFTDVTAGLGVLLSLLIGLFGGIFFVVLYQYAIRHRELTSQGLAVIPAYILVAAVLGWLTVRAAKKSAGRRNDVAKRQAVRIILIGNAVIAGMAMTLMIYLSIQAGVL